VTNKELAYDIASACKMPINEARKLLYFILETMVHGLRKDKLLKIRDFGRWKLFIQKRVHLPDGRFVQQTKYKCSFIPKGKLNILLRNKWYREYANILANKFARLIKEGDKKGALKTKKKLRKYLIGKRRMAEWLDERGRLPFPLSKIECDTSNGRENGE